MRNKENICNIVPSSCVITGFSLTGKYIYMNIYISSSLSKGGQRPQESLGNPEKPSKKITPEHP